MAEIIRLIKSEQLNNVWQHFSELPKRNFFETLVFTVTSCIKDLARNFWLYFFGFVSCFTAGLILSLLMSNFINLTNFFDQELDKAELTIFLNPDFDSDKLNEISRQLKDYQGVTEVQYLSKEQAYQQFSKELNLELDPNLAVNPLPAYFVVKLKPGIFQTDPKFSTNFKREFLVNPIVSEIQIIDSVIAGKTKLANVFSSLVTWLAALIIAVVAVVLYLISTLITLKRVSELRILKILGANFFQSSFTVLLNIGIVAVVACGLGCFLAYYCITNFYPVINEALKIIFPSFVLQLPSFTNFVAIIVLIVVVSMTASWCSLVKYTDA